MISIRRLMDERKKHDERRNPEPRGAILAWRSNLSAVSQCIERAVPGLGLELKQNLAEARQALTSNASEDTIATTQERVEAELSTWADKAWEHHNSSMQLMREMIATTLRAGETAATSQKNYASQFGDLNGQLHTLAAIDNLTDLRKSLLDCTQALKTCIDRMANDGEESLRRLTTEVAECRAKLEESERLSATDPLTSLANRRCFEEQLGHFISERREFGVILLDLNGFKQVNDRYGHLAGDDLLRQFAAELRSHFRASDVVARWGGDEFAVIVEGYRTYCYDRVSRIRRWILGDYKITHNGALIKVHIEAAIGVAEWDRIEAAADLIARADAMLYSFKTRRNAA